MRKLFPLVLLALVGGCFTVSETPPPAIAPTANSADTTNTTVSVRGFTTVLTEYTMVDGYQTVFYDSNPYWYGGGVATAHTTTIIPHRRTSDAFLEQAKNRLESMGFNVMAQTPDYIVEARFVGPMTSGGDIAKSMAWFLCSLLTCDRGTQTWQGHLKIHDNRTGRLVFSKDYVQRYEVMGFSPIPLFGISYYDRTRPAYMQCWCLGALTDTIVADTARFLTARK